MNQLLLVKNLFESKIMSNASSSVQDPWLKHSDIKDKPRDFGKILRQRDRQEKPSKCPENFSQSDKKPKAEEDDLEPSEENVIPSERWSTKDNTDTFSVPDEYLSKEDDSGWLPEVNELAELQIAENFSTDEEQITKDKTAKDPTELPDENNFVSVITTEQRLKPVIKPQKEKGLSENLSDFTTRKTDLPTIKIDAIDNSDKGITEETQKFSSVPLEAAKTNSKITKAISIAPEGKVKSPAGILNTPAPDALQNASNLVNLQHFDTWNNFGIKSAPRVGDRKGGSVSSVSPALTEVEDPLHRETTISSNGSRVAEVLLQKDDMRYRNDSEQHFEDKEVVLPQQVQPKTAVNTYEEVQQDHLETVQGMIATLEQKMDEIKRTRRNSVIVKVELENGESLNCQVTLSHADVAIRFPALEESFKMQILNHWESLRKFAQTRQLNLAEPHFITQTSL